MTGTGTQTDPFIVDNWADFCTIDTSSTEIYVKWADSENKVIDFNSIQPEGFTEVIKMPANVDFNGWTLRNFHSTASSAFEGASSANHSSINNLVIENFYCTGRYIFAHINSRNGIFSGIANGVSAVTFGYYSDFSCCSVNLQMHSAAQMCIFSNSACEKSDIILDISGSRVNITSDCAAYNSRFSGKIQVNGNNVSISIGYSSIFNIVSNQPLHCPTSNGISIFNLDSAQNTSTSDKNLVGVTTEQLKDATYLASIGFPIGVG